MTTAVKTDNGILESRIRQIFSELAEYYTYLSKRAMAAALCMETLRLMVEIAGLAIINEVIQGYGALIYGRDNLADMVPDPEQWVIADMFFGIGYFLMLTIIGNIFRGSSEAFLKALRKPEDGQKKTSVNMGRLLISAAWLIFCLAGYHYLISSIGYPMTVLLAVCTLIDGSIMLRHADATEGLRKSAVFKERAETFSVTQAIREEIEHSGSYTDYIDNQRYVFTIDDTGDFPEEIEPPHS